MNRKHLVRTLVPAVALSLAVTACSSSSASKSSEKKTTTTSSTSASATVASQTGASALRAGLTGLLTEHVALASMATNAALRGDSAGFNAYAAALNGPTDSNTADLVAAITSAYGEETGTAFDGLWRSEKHIPQFVAYTQAVAAGDDAAKSAALGELTAYATTFGETLHQVNENLPADAVTQDIVMHATTLTAVIDAQKAGDGTAPGLLRKAVAHMSTTADVLAAATVAKLPGKF